jgi:hypothetical protein
VFPEGCSRTLGNPKASRTTAFARHRDSTHEKHEKQYVQEQFAPRPYSPRNHPQRDQIVAATSREGLSVRGECDRMNIVCVLKRHNSRADVWLQNQRLPCEKASSVMWSSSSNVDNSVPRYRSQIRTVQSFAAEANRVPLWPQPDYPAAIKNKVRHRDPAND